MSEISEAAGAIAGLILGGMLLLLMAPTLDPLTPVQIEGWGRVLFFIGAILAVITAGAAVVRLLK